MSDFLATKSMKVPILFLALISAVSGLYESANNIEDPLLFRWMLTVRTNTIYTAHIIVTIVDTSNMYGVQKFTKNCLHTFSRSVSQIPVHQLLPPVRFIFYEFLCTQKIIRIRKTRNCILSSGEAKSGFPAKFLFRETRVSLH